MGIIELLTAVGEGDVRVQSLRQSLSAAKSRRDGITEISFHTDVVDTAGAIAPGAMVGLVIWLPRDKLPEPFKTSM